jgi:hypothetical protein
MKAGRSLHELAVELKRQKDARRDFLADTTDMRMNAEGELVIDGIRPMGVQETAHDQIAAYAGIPRQYYRRMKDCDSQLLSENVNAWLVRNPERRMVRTLDGSARAFLSEKYRPIDNFEIIEAVMPVLMGMDGLRIESCEVTERKMYIKGVNPRLEAKIKKGDVVQSGIVISNSEIGLGSVQVSPLIFRLVCTNGMIAADSGIRKYHVGRPNESDENYRLYRNETLIADDRAFFLKLQDTVRAASELSKFELVVNRMRQAVGLPITSKNVPKVVELTSKDYGVMEKESMSVMDYLIREGDFSLYGLANAVTRTAQDSDSYDRATVLESTGWDMLNMGRDAWQRYQAA